MNTLSWLLYSADVASGLGNSTLFLVVISFMSIASCLFLLFVATISESDNEMAQKILQTTPRYLKSSIALVLIAGVINVLTPNRETILSIAASEAAEEVVTTPEATILRQLIRKKLEEALNPAPQKE